MKKKALILFLATMTATSILFTGCSKKEAETPPVAEETIEETEVTEPEETEPVKEVETTESEENTTGQLSGAGEYNAEEEDAFYNDDEVYEAEKGNNTETQTPSETTEKPEGWHTGDDLDAYLDSIGGTDIIYGESGPGSFYPGDDYEFDW